MNILMLGRWLPPLRCPVRSTREYQFARALARSHRLTLAFVTDNQDAAGTISVLRSEFGDLEFASVPRGWQSLMSALRLATGESCTLSYARSAALRTRLADRLKSTSYGLVFVSSSSMIQYALDVDPAIPLAIDFGDVESEWWRGQSERGAFPGARFFHAEATRLRTAEAAGARRAARCFTATDAAASTVQTLAPEAPVTVVPNGLDPDFFGSGMRRGKTPTVVFNGSLADEAEIHDFQEFCRTVLPAVRSRVPGVRFVVIGRERSAAARLEVLPGVEIAPGSDVRPFLHNHTVAVAPLRSATDVRALVLEPMAAAVPVVATSKACEQVMGRPGQDLHVADDALEFALHVVRLLEDAALRREVGHCGRRLVEARFSWDVYGGQLAEAVGAIVKASGGPTGPPTTDSFAAVAKG
ncbi:MAG: glycosyltransferase family 4 protein [Candidatus Rokuibacteriota bacterium]